MRRFLLHSTLASLVMIAGFLLPGCKETPTTSGGPDTTSNDVTLPAPPAGQGFQIVLDTFSVPAGQEIIRNFYRKIPLEAEGYVSLIQVASNLGNRSLEIYKSDAANIPDHVEDSFAPVQWDTWDLISTSLEEKTTWRLANYSGFRLAPHQQMNFRTHYLNTGTTPIRGKVVINIWTTLKKEDLQYTVGVLYADNKNIKIPAHTAATFCKVIKPFTEDTQVMVMTGSFHTHGKKLVMGKWDGSKITDTLYINQSWEKPAVMDLACGTTIKAGDSLAVITTYENPTDTEIPFGQRLQTEEQSEFYIFFSPMPANGRTIYDFDNGFLMESHPL